MTNSIKILENNISIVNMPMVMTMVKDHCAELKGRYICVCNVHTTVMAHDDTEYRRIQNNAVLNLPDGKPLSMIGRKHGFKRMGRVAGPDFMHEVFKVSAQYGWKHFFYGSTSETLGILKNRLTENYPSIDIAGMYSPPFRELTVDEDNQINKMIELSKADFIWIGLGAPKQEIYMSEHEGMFQGVMIGVGAGFNFHAGTVKRSPLWMQKVGLEWLYRMMQEPRRLWKRYLITNFKFIWLLMTGH